MKEQIKTIEDDCEVLKDRIIQLEKEIQHKTIKYDLTNNKFEDYF
jgi:hypothetical protein